MKTILAAFSLAALSTTAFATPTQFSIPTSQSTRAEVQAATGQSSRMVNLGEAINFRIPDGQRSRADVSAELKTTGAGHTAESSRTRMASDARLYVGG